jgi:rhodanese-related sulfurtransferase
MDIGKVRAMNAQQVRRGKTFQQLVAEAKGEIREITAPELKQWFTEGKDLVLVDVREPMEYQNGHIGNAVNIPRGLLELQIDEVVADQDKSIVMYCGGGSRSALAAQTLKTMGYDQVYSLQGGYRFWAE